MPGDQGKQREVRSDGGRQGRSKEGQALGDVARRLEHYVRQEDSLVGAVGLRRGLERPVNLDHVRQMASQQEAIVWALGSHDLHTVQLPEGTSKQAAASLRDHERMIANIRHNRADSAYEIVKRDFLSEAAKKGKETLGPERRSEAAKKGKETQGAAGRSEATKKGNETRGAEGRSEATKKGRETLGAAGRSAATKKGHETRRKRQQAERAERDD
jgi:hypothetical protein